jgi:hypothetical protein
VPVTLPEKLTVSENPMTINSLMSEVVLEPGTNVVAVVGEINGSSAPIVDRRR